MQWLKHDWVYGYYALHTGFTIGTLLSAEQRCTKENKPPAPWHYGAIGLSGATSLCTLLFTTRPRPTKTISILNAKGSLQYNTLTNLQIPKTLSVLKDRKSVV